MKEIEIFYQLEGATEILHITSPPDESFGALKARIGAKHSLGTDLAIFLEDADDLVDETVTVGALAKPTGCKVHLHRCRHIIVTVRFSSQGLEHEFRPGTTVARVKHWAAKQLGMSKEDAGEHVYAHFAGQRIPFLRGDVLLLPIENATLEEFARWFLLRLGEDREALRAHGIAAIEVRVFSGPGQSAGRRMGFE